MIADDQDLSERVARVLEQRDKFREVASEMIATLLLDRNKAAVPDKLRELCDRVWKPAFDSAMSGTELTDEQISLALAAHAIDVNGAHKRIAALVKGASA